MRIKDFFLFSLGIFMISCDTDYIRKISLNDEAIHSVEVDGTEVFTDKVQVHIEADAYDGTISESSDSESGHNIAVKVQRVDGIPITSLTVEIEYNNRGKKFSPDLITTKNGNYFYYGNGMCPERITARIYVQGNSSAYYEFDWPILLSQKGEDSITENGYFYEN